MSAGRREAVADWAMVLAGLGLLGSLFLPWSHQLSRAMLAQYGPTAALQGVPRDPTAWQVYSALDVVLALLAGALLTAALRGGRVARLALMAALAVAIAFTLHALSVPPTNGAALLGAGVGSGPGSSGAGPGETLALVALALGVGGLTLSLTAD